MIGKLKRGINSMVITNAKLLLKKYILREKINFSLVHVISSNTKIEVDREGILYLGRMANITNGRIEVRKGASLDVADKVFMNSGCIVTCRERITIGKDTLFGPNVLIYDHDHQLDSDGVIQKKEFITKPVKIGDNCWIGAGTIILKGTVIGNNCVVGAGCILNGVYPDNSIVVQKRETSIISKKYSDRGINND